MAEKGVAMAILGIVAVIAVVGLVLLFSGATGEAVLPGASKVYGGATRQSSDYTRQVGETVQRYVTPVPGDFSETGGLPDGNYPVGPYYAYQKSYYRDYFEFQRDPCPDKAFPVVEDRANVRARIGVDCFPSEVRPDMFCCALGGSAGHIAAGLYD